MLLFARLAISKHVWPQKVETEAKAPRHVVECQFARQHMRPPQSPEWVASSCRWCVWLGGGGSCRCKARFVLPSVALRWPGSPGDVEGQSEGLSCCSCSRTNALRPMMPVNVWSCQETGPPTDQPYHTTTINQVFTGSATSQTKTHRRQAIALPIASSPNNCRSNQTTSNQASKKQRRTSRCLRATRQLGPLPYADRPARKFADM